MLKHTTPQKRPQESAPQGTLMAALHKRHMAMGSSNKNAGSDNLWDNNPENRKPSAPKKPRPLVHPKPIRKTRGLSNELTEYVEKRASGTSSRRTASRA